MTKEMIINTIQNISDTNAFEEIVDRISITNSHMKRLGGKLHNDKLAWKEIFHDQSYTDHRNHYTVASRLLEEEWDLCSKFKLEKQDIEVIMDRYDRDQEIMKQYRVEYNRPVFKSWMSTVDVINKIIKEEQVSVKAGQDISSNSLIRSLIRDSIYETNGIEGIESIENVPDADTKTVSFGPNDMFEIEISIKVKPKQ